MAKEIVLMSDDVKCPECKSNDVELIEGLNFDDDDIAQPSSAAEDENTTASRDNVSHGSSVFGRSISIKNYRCNQCGELFDLLPNSF